MADEDDGDLQRAIALSQTSDVPTTNMVVNEEDEDLKRAIALSLAAFRPDCKNLDEESGHGKTKSDTIAPLLKERTSIATASTMTPSAARNAGFVGLDRKAMEEERLARLASKKRKASISPPPLQRDRPEEKKAKACEREGVAKTRNTSNDGSTNGSKISLEPNKNQIKPPDLQFPHGVFKKTWSKAHPRDNDIKIEEVLRKDELKTAFFSSFMWDSEWIFNKINTRSTNMILAVQARSEQEREQRREDAKTQGFNNIRLCFPPLSGLYTCMHSKLMLLFYSDSLRIVVPTANLTAYDWGETGVMENTVFLIDLPRRAAHLSGGNAQVFTFFGKELLYFLDKMGAPQNLLDGILNFDFSDTGHLAFVHSVFGPHYGDDLGRTGFPGLSRAVQNLGLQTKKLELDIASSSIGSLTDLTMNNLYGAARGADVIAQAQQRMTKKSKEKPAKPNEALQNFRVYFPTKETVIRSLGGPDSAGTIILPEKYFTKPEFPRSIFRDYESVRNGLLSHNKLIFARGRTSTASIGSDNERSVAWIYTGSANLSESAWGRLVMDRSRKELKLTCNNWECGVLMGVATVGVDDSLIYTLKGVLDVPFKVPGRPYDSREPWHISR